MCTEINLYGLKRFTRNPEPNDYIVCIYVFYVYMFNIKLSRATTQVNDFVRATVVQKLVGGWV